VVALLVAVLGGAITAKLEWHNLVAAYAWTPWVLLPLVRRPGPTRRGLVAAGIAFGMQALAGHPNTWLLTGIAAAVILVATDPWRRGLARAIGLGCLGAAGGAVQLVPTAVLTTLSVRSTALTADDLFAAASTPFDPLGIAFQGAFARMSDGHWDMFNGWYPDGVFAHLESAAYLGLPVIALVATALTIRRARPLLVAAAVLVAIPAIEAFKPEILLSIPFLNGIRSPVRAYVPAALLLGVVAGLAVGRRPPRGRITARAGIAVGAFVAAWGATLALAGAAPDLFVSILRFSTTFGDAASLERGRVEAITDLTALSPLAAELVVGVVALVVIGAWARIPRARPLAAPLLAAIAAVPLLLWGPAPNGTSTIGGFTSANTPFTQAVASASPHRILTIGSPGWYAGMPDELAAAGIPDLRMFSSLDLRASDELVDPAAQVTEEAAALRRALGIDTVVTFDGAPCPGREVARSDEEHAVVCHDDAALSTPWWIPADLVTDGGPSGSPIRPREAFLDPAAAVASAVGARSVARDQTHVTATIDAPADGWAWVDVAWWPGWTATVDGRGVETRRALGGTLVAMPAGTHQLELALVPWDALLGLGMGVVALLAAVVWARRERRGRADEAGAGG
jgi:hypothetical protein